MVQEMVPRKRKPVIWIMMMMIIIIIIIFVVINGNGSNTYYQIIAIAMVVVVVVMTCFKSHKEGICFALNLFTQSLLHNILGTFGLRISLISLI